MIIQHNISALNSYRNLSMNNNSISGNLEKLSSGYRINRAGDDAAGLAISEKMRAQITGLETAQANAEDGISLVQTAEGALTEVHTMLNRMVELAQQSANGTIQDDVDRENIQAEVDALTDEIDRISKSTNFNGINLLNGELGGGTKAPKVELVGTTATANSQVAVAGVYQGTTALTANGDVNTTEETYTIEYKIGEDVFTKTVKYTKASSTDGANQSATNLASAINADEELSKLFTASTDNADIVLTANQSGTEGAIVTKLGGGGVDTPNGTGNPKGAIDAGVLFDATALGNGAQITIDGKTYSLSGTANEEAGIFDSEADLIAHLKTIGYKVVDKNTGVEQTDNFQNNVLVRDPAFQKGLELQIGDSSDDFNQITVSIDAMDSKGLGISDISLADQASAQDAVEVIKNAINTVSSQRGELGAIQNRLEHTINNLGVTAENMTAAESRIRDVDMAKEMMEYTKNNILIQSSQAMLAQANQLPQGVLQLLQ